VCRPCYLEKARQRERKRTQTNKDNLYELKSNGCAICGYNKYNGSLDFHHVNQEDKSFFLGVRSMHRKDEEIIDEVNKCILLCSNCHREIHHIELKKLKEEII
jgi:5-methylcytosine-specific restriction endonuclease McrA